MIFRIRSKPFGVGERHAAVGPVEIRGEAAPLGSLAVEAEIAAERGYVDDVIIGLSEDDVSDLEAGDTFEIRVRGLRRQIRARKTEELARIRREIDRALTTAGAASALGTRVVTASPSAQWPWGSMSTRSTLRSAAASEAPRFTAVVVLPTPPFCIATA